MLKKVLISIFILLTIVFGILFTMIWSKVGEIPSSKELSEIHHSSASEVYSKDGVLLGRYFTENRTNITFEEIPQNLINALIATEDVRFFEHAGIDYQSLGRVIIKSIILQDRSAGGGSTLSQQLAKNLYPRAGNGKFDLAAAKVREVIVASRLENIYSKNDLITLYLNTVSFGEDVFGLETASMRYFNKSPHKLKTHESAVLVGMLKATTYYNPRLYPDQTKVRRNTVISQMNKYGFLSDTQKDSLSSLPLNLNYKRHSTERGTAPYFKSYIKPLIADILSNTTDKEGKPYNLETDGLKITVAIDSKMQYYADSAMSKHMAYLQKIFDQQWKYSKPWDESPNLLRHAIRNSDVYKSLKASGLTENEIKEEMSKPTSQSLFSHSKILDESISQIEAIKRQLMLLQAGLIAIEPASGEVKAWVGGIDFNFFQYDHVTSLRQVGSTFKPIVYATALEQGTDPCKYFKNEQVVYDEYDNWSPSNANNMYEGYYSLKGALTHSVNTVSAQVIIDTGIDTTIALAHKLGIVHDLPPVPSLALGTAELSLLEMVSAYATIANKGFQLPPVMILKIENATGEVIYKHTPRVGNPVLSQKTARLITDFMQNVVNEGTAKSLRHNYGFDIDIAGKTGTTQSGADGWFIGFTPNIVCGVWVGGEYPAIHFKNGYGQGATMALPIWANMMQLSLADPKFKNWKTSEFDSLTQDLKWDLDCPDFTEELTILDKIFGVKDLEKNPDAPRPFFKKLRELFR